MDCAVCGYMMRKSMKEEGERPTFKVLFCTKEELKVCLKIAAIVNVSPLSGRVGYMTGMLVE